MDVAEKRPVRELSGGEQKRLALEALLQSDADVLRSALRRIRVFAGYSGWRENQLEDELAANAWFVLDAVPEDLMPENPSQLWSAVLRRQPGRLSLVASYPPDPRLN